MGKLRVLVLFGGRSGEHEVSLSSATSIMEGLLACKTFEVIPVGITREGDWLYGSDPLLTLKSGDLPGGNVRVAILPFPASGGLYILEGEEKGKTIEVDVVFPVLHGTFGEDGTVQGLLELAGIPYVGAGVLGSAAGMDKIIMKAVLKEGGLPVGEYIWFTVTDWIKDKERIMQDVEEKLGFPCFIKPANLGSSVGISKAYDNTGLSKGISEAGRYDNRILVERYLSGREIECSILGNESPEASVLGEVIPCNDFYDYRAKYLDEQSRIVIPSTLSNEVADRVREMSIKTFSLLDCAGFARVDCFVDDKSGSIYVNEINTIPGFTSISMFPKLWEESGLSFTSLLTRLINLALERFASKGRLETVLKLDV